MIRLVVMIAALWMAPFAKVFAYQISGTKMIASATT